MDLAEENLHWLDSKYYEIVDGRNGNTKWEIERVSKASINIDWENQKCTIKGKKDQIEIAKKRIKEELDTVDGYIDDSYMELDFISQPKHIAGVIGKKGANIERLKKKFNVNLKVVDDKLFIKKGDPEKIKKATDFLKQFVWSFDSTKDSNCEWFRHFFGSPENIMTVQSSLDRDVSLIRNPAIDANTPLQQNVAESLLKAFNLAKESQQRSVVGIPSVRYLVHLGMMVSRENPGTYESHSESLMKSLTYQKLTASELDIDGLKSLPLIKEYLRYDLSIYTPKPFHKIRHRVFLSNDREEKLRFITNEEVVANGYSLKNDRKIAYVDLIDPEHGMTTRINTLTYDDSQSDGNISNPHLEILVPFFNGIKIRQKNETVPEDKDTEDDKDKDLHIPISKLPSGYNLKFYRRVTRASYRFDGEDGENIITTSKEEVHIQEDTFVPTDQSEVIDLFLENESINDLLKRNDWQAQQVVGKLAKLLRSSNIMLAKYLKIK